MKQFFIAIFVMLVSFNLAGCSNMSNQDTGTLAGGVAGGLLGSQIGQGSGQLLAIGAGTLIGAYVGGSLGKNMDDTDRLKMNNALENNQVGQPAYWTNARTGNRYRVTPVKNVTHRGNRYCREYRTNAYIAGRSQQITGTACRRADGSWQMVS